MDFWSHMFDNDYRQRADIESLKRLAKNRRAMRAGGIQKIASNDQRIEQLEEQVGELALLCRALLTVLRETSAVDPEHLHRVMERIDAEDGVVDGKITPQTPPDDPQDPPQVRAW